MKQQEAVDILYKLRFLIQKIRSNAIEGLGGYGASISNLPEAELNVLKFVAEPVFRDEFNLLEIINRVLENYEEIGQISPMALYNILVIVNQVPMIGAGAILLGYKFPQISPPPDWIIEGWKNDESP